MDYLTPLDPYHAALDAAMDALMAAWATTNPTERAAHLANAARWLAAAQAANDAERRPDAGPA